MKQQSLFDQPAEEPTHRTDGGLGVQYNGYAIDEETAGERITHAGVEVRIGNEMVVVEVCEPYIAPFRTTFLGVDNGIHDHIVFGRVTVFDSQGNFYEHHLTRAPLDKLPGPKYAYEMSSEARMIPYEESPEPPKRKRRR